MEKLLYSFTFSDLPLFRAIQEIIDDKYLVIESWRIWEENMINRREKKKHTSWVY